MDEDRPTNSTFSDSCAAPCVASCHADICKREKDRKTRKVISQSLYKIHRTVKRNKTAHFSSNPKSYGGRSRLHYFNRERQRAKSDLRRRHLIRWESFALTDLCGWTCCPATNKATYGASGIVRVLGRRYRFTATTSSMQHFVLSVHEQSQREKEREQPLVLMFRQDKTRQDKTRRH
jgi:hypothetical protein